VYVDSSRLAPDPSNLRAPEISLVAGQRCANITDIRCGVSIPSVQTKLDCCNSASSRPRRLWGDAQRVKRPSVWWTRSHLDSHDRRQSQSSGLSAIRLPDTRHNIYGPLYVYK